MGDIIHNCTDWPEEVCDFGWRTSFQQMPDSNVSFSGIQTVISIYKRDLPPRRRPEIYATPIGRELELEFEGGNGLISQSTVEMILGQLQSILKQC
jgi:hypothetical protein